MKLLTVKLFESLLNDACRRLKGEALGSRPFDKSSDFENGVRKVIKDLLADYEMDVEFDPHPYVFPDIVLGRFGIEVKFTTNDTWRSVGNSVFEGTRGQEVEHIYVIFGKMGGKPDVKWDKYDDCVIHVRTSHVPRFELQIHPKESLFSKMGISYADFRKLSIHERMEHIRVYARGRLKKGERLWWLEEKPGEGHSLPIQARLYMTLDQQEKRRLRAEAALLCPQIVKPSRSKHKYDDATLFLLTYHGVLCPQARDLFSAGSVAMRSDSARGGNYVQRALADIETEMYEAALAMEDALFKEYWGISVHPADRISCWLKRADEFAVNWKPSDVLFPNRQA